MAATCMLLLRCGMHLQCMCLHAPLRPLGRRLGCSVLLYLSQLVASLTLILV